MQLGLENKKKTMWAAALGVIALVVFAYEFIPMFTESSTPGTSAQAAAPSVLHTPPPRSKVKPGKKPKVENLDPTLKLNLLAASEQTHYQGNGRNIFISQAEEVAIQKPVAPANTDAAESVGQLYQAAATSSACSDSFEVLWIRQPARRTEEDLLEAE